MDGKKRKKETNYVKDPSKLSLDQANRHKNEDPLSNYVVLTNIFSHLDNSDIETCCQVNKCWNSVADPLFVREYKVSLGQDFHHSGPERSYKVTISKRSTYNSARVQETTYSPEDASNFLEKAVQSERVAYNFILSKWDENEASVANFLLKFGNLAPKLTIERIVTTRTLCETLARFFPNVKHLDLSSSGFQEQDDLYFDENQVENRIKYLKRIDYSRSTHVPKSQSWVDLLRMAPNLEEIYNFPVLDVDALTETGRGSCVKSISFLQIDADEGFRAAFEKLANLDLKLKVFDFSYWYEVDDEPDSICNAEIDPFLRRIIQSSHDSLESLSLYKSGTFDFQHISPMNALKRVTFIPKTEEDSRFYCPRKFISRTTILPIAFPNVSCVKILRSLSQFNAPRIARWFPEVQFAPWGVRKLKLEDPSASILQVLSRSFPALTDLQLHLGSRGDGLQRIIPTISICWPELEVVSIRAFGFWHEIVDKGDWTFDSVFTGIPERDVLQLRAADPATWNTLFTPEQIENWKQASTLRKLTKLKVLKFEPVGDMFWERKFLRKLESISLVSKEFGFQFLPGLQIVVRTLKDEHFNEWQRVIDVKTSLEPLVNVKVEKA